MLELDAITKPRFSSRSLRCDDDVESCQSSGGLQAEGSFGDDAQCQRAPARAFPICRP